ncbi:MAG TPA: hypothetical protein VGK91_07720 [Candidatus Udaeobacter sp.]
MNRVLIFVPAATFGQIIPNATLRYSRGKCQQDLKSRAYWIVPMILADAKFFAEKCAHHPGGKAGSGDAVRGIILSGPHD